MYLRFQGRKTKNLQDLKIPLMPQIRSAQPIRGIGRRIVTFLTYLKKNFSKNG